MATATISFIDTVYWASGSGLLGVEFTKTDYLGGSPETAFIDFVQEASGESSTLEYNLTWPTPVVAGDIVTYSYDSLVGVYMDSLGNPVQDASFVLTNCKGSGGLPAEFEGGWFNGYGALLESLTPGLPNSRYLSMSYWYKSEIGEPLEDRAFISTSEETESGRPSYVGEALSVTTNVLKKLIIRVEGETGLEVVYGISLEELPDEDGIPHNILIAIDSQYPGTKPLIYAFIDDTQLTLNIDSYIAGGEPMNLSEPYWQLGVQGATPDTIMLGCVDHVFIVNSYVAIQYQAVRNLFHNASLEPVYLGDSGEFVTGSQAWIYCNGLAVPLLVNKGSAPDFYSIGAWQDCGTPPAITITTLSIPDGSLGVAYSKQIETDRVAIAPVWTIISGALPTGLSLGGGTGIISGTPTEGGTFVFTVEIVDNFGPSDTQDYTLVCVFGVPLTWSNSLANADVNLSPRFNSIVSAYSLLRMPDGNLYPYINGYLSAKIYDVDTDTWSTTGLTHKTLNPFNGAIGSPSICKDGVFYGLSWVNLWKYEGTTDTWTALASITGISNNQLSRSVLCLDTSGTYDILSFGGREYAPAFAITKAFGYKISTNTWTALAAMPTAFMDGIAIGLADGRILIGGGRYYSNKMYLYDPTTNSYTATTDIPAAIDWAVPTVQVLLSDGTAYISGGENHKVAYTFDPILETWTAQVDTPFNSTGPYHGACQLEDGRILLYKTTTFETANTSYIQAS